jgi:hypothetical protein
MVIDADAVQPFESVTVTVKVPAGSPVAAEPVWGGMTLHK